MYASSCQICAQGIVYHSNIIWTLCQFVYLDMPDLRNSVFTRLIDTSMCEFETDKIIYPSKIPLGIWDSKIILECGSVFLSFMHYVPIRFL